MTGRSIRASLQLACVAAREARIPRRIEDVAEAFDMASEVEKKELKRTIRLVARTLGAHHVTGPEEYLEKFHSDLGYLPPSSDVRALWNRVQDQYAWQVRSHLALQASYCTTHLKRAAPQEPRARCARSRASVKSR